jgi:hypothetical protein
MLLSRPPLTFRRLTHCLLRIPAFQANKSWIINLAHLVASSSRM